MKVLFVSSGNKGKFNPIIYAQQKSLESAYGQFLIIDNYLIEGKGVLGYLKNVKSLKNVLKNNSYDIIHSHFSFSGIVVSIAGRKPVIASLMGSDVNKNKLYRLIAGIFVRFFWSHTIVKSNDMAKHFPEKKVTVIPNGVDISKFKPINRQKACEALGWDISKIHILFAANPIRKEKNFELTEAAVNIVSKKHNNLMLHVLDNVPNEDIPKYMNASDIVVLSSKWEGSPNVIKEAMACNRPIVCTDVGDVSWLFGNEEGHFLSSHNVKDFSKKLEECIRFSKRNKATNGRSRIIELKLDSDSVAKRIKALYDNIVQ